MLKTAIRSTLRLARNYHKFSLSLSNQPKFTFSNNIEVVSKLRTAVEEQITHEESNIQDLSQFTNFFQNQGWTINYNGVQVQLAKKNSPYDLRILFNAKTPMPAQENEQGEEQMQQENPDYTDVTVYVKKDGAPKWLYCEFMITNNNDAHLGLASFTADYETQKSDRARGKTPSVSYAGPQLSSLEQKFQQSIYEFIEGVGVTGQILQRAAEFSISYEHQFYIQWLKDFRSLV